MPEGTAYLAVVISEVPHANILGIDTRKPRRCPASLKF
jgi:hypothetical protein